MKIKIESILKNEIINLKIRMFVLMIGIAFLMLSLFCMFLLIFYGFLNFGVIDLNTSLKLLLFSIVFYGIGKQFHIMYHKVKKLKNKN